MYCCVKNNAPLQVSYCYRRPISAERNPLSPGYRTVCLCALVCLSLFASMAAVTFAQAGNSSRQEGASIMMQNRSVPTVINTQKLQRSGTINCSRFQQLQSSFITVMITFYIYVRHTYHRQNGWCCEFRRSEKSLDLQLSFIYNAKMVEFPCFAGCQHSLLSGLLVGLYRDC